jgi:hypothetical protein
MVQLEEISYFVTHLLTGAKDSMYLNYAIIMSWRSKKIQKVLRLTMIPNLAFLVLYLILQFSWVLSTLLYVPLVMIQFLINYYVLLKSRDSLKNLFDDGRKKIDLVEKITDIVTDSIFCNITLVTSTLLYVIFRSIGVLVPVCQILYALIYSIIIGYTMCLNLLIEQGLTFEQRLDFAERHLVYLIGYGLPLTIGYNTLPLMVYFAIQSVLTPLMIINSKQHFKPIPIPGGPIKLITFLNQINKKIFFELLIMIRRINSWSKIT